MRWKKLEPFLPESAAGAKGGRPCQDNRQVFEGILWIWRPFMSQNPRQNQSAITQPLAGFDPFRDRLSRDIGNDRSPCFGKPVPDGSLTFVEERSVSLLKRDLGDCYREYVKRRLDRYRLAFDRIQKSGNDPILQGLILWDLRLFFEMHEVLETAWRDSDSPPLKFC